MSELQASVVYRKGPLTVEDYDEAIAFLQEARAQLATAGYFCPCGDVCSPNSCHHNPLVMARAAARALHQFRCFHCGEVFNLDNGQEHFGRSEDEIVRCLEQKAGEL